MKGTVRLTYKTFFCMAGLYLIIPVLIFFIGYLKLSVGIICSLAVAAVFFFAVRDCSRDADGKLTDSSFDLPVKFLVIACIYAVIVTILTGVGEYVWTAYDHAFRRATLNDLLNYKWPVIYDPSTQTDPDVIAQMSYTTPQGFVYYFTYWMVPAVVGKVLGFTAANITLILWNSFGLVLILTGMSMYLKRATYASLFVLLCFSGLDVIPFVLNGFTFCIEEQWLWVDGCVPHMSYISNFNNLENVYHQAIPCYLIVIMLMLMKNNRYIGTVASLIFAYSPWTTFGMIIPAAVQLFRRDNMSSDRKRNIKNILSFGNLVVPLVMLFIFGAFYSSKSDSTSERGFVVSYYGSLWWYLLAYLILIAVEVLPSAALVFTSRRKEPLYWGAIILLLICPIYKISDSNDLAMRASMPALFILAVFLAGKISEYTLEDDRLAAKGRKRQGVKAHMKLVVLSLVLVGMSYVTGYMMSVILPSILYGDLGSAHDIESFGNQSTPFYTEKIEDQFFVNEPENEFFFKYLAK